MSTEKSGLKIAFSTLLTSHLQNLILYWNFQRQNASLNFFSFALFALSLSFLGEGQKKGRGGCQQNQTFWDTLSRAISFLVSLLLLLLWTLKGQICHIRETSEIWPRPDTQEPSHNPESPLFKILAKLFIGGLAFSLPLLTSNSFRSKPTKEKSLKH